MALKQDQSTKPGNAAADDGAVPVAPPCAMVIFGAAGDLTKRLVVPALYNLVNSKYLPKEFRLIGVDHNAKSVEQWRDGLTADDEPVGFGRRWRIPGRPYRARRLGGGSPSA